MKAQAEKMRAAHQSKSFEQKAVERTKKRSASSSSMSHETFKKFKNEINTMVAGTLAEFKKENESSDSDQDSAQLNAFEKEDWVIKEHKIDNEFEIKENNLFLDRCDLYMFSTQWPNKKNKI